MRNARAVFSLLLGLIAAVSLPAAVLSVERTERLELLWAGVGVPVAFVLGLAARAVGGAGLARAERTLRRRGAAIAHVGRLLGLLAMLLAGTGAIALVVYALLTWRGRS